MSACLVCLKDVDTQQVHKACATRLFGALAPPSLNIELAKLHTLGLAMVGHTSISGIQRKISLRHGSGRNTLQVAVDGGRYILKPQAQTFPNLPENEHVTMLLAELVGLNVPPCGLIELTDKTLAYIVKRFDRADIGKLRQEDFCQLAEKSPKEKYDGSAELCFRLLDKFASEPGIEKLKLLRLMMFTWWTGNGDMHLKNFSVLTTEGIHALSPVYDLLCTRLVIPDDQLALPVQAKKDRLTPRVWRELARYAGIPEKAYMRLAGSFRKVEAPAVALVQASFLPVEMKAAYVDLLRSRTGTLLKA